ncbi:hypothetical protein GCM10009541_33650 [Micromonospora gifhornensis]|uniref:Choice-of-anchor A family protein n=2 Tax=Micromonospora gifhornensis TaxID=84594 RepID=A0ABQ4IAA3_9ACTN|nr:hypothetical protein Vgi01_15300 [Micromonospora gifhornensis]
MSFAHHGQPSRSCSWRPCRSLPRLRTRHRRWERPVGPVNPVDPALSFGVMTEGDANLVGDENEGTIAVGGNLSFGNYQVAGQTAGSFIAPGDSVPSALVVGGRVDFANSVPGSRLQVLSGGYAKVGDLTGTFVRDTDNNGAAVNTRILPADDYEATPRVELTVRQDPDDVGPTSPIDFAAAFQSFRSTSNSLATCANTVVLRNPEGEVLPRPIPPGTNAVVTLAPGVTNVLNISATDLNNIDILTFADRPTASTPLLVNVDTSDVGNEFDWEVPIFAGIGGEEARYILFNFPTATELTLTAESASLEGTIYAPNADLTDLASSNTEGTIITRTFEHRGGEVHYFPFSTTLTCNGEAPAAISLVKSSTTTVITEVGQQVPYRYLVTNTGEVTLTEVTVTDVRTPPSSGSGLSPISCPRTELAPGESMTCTATYTVTQADLEAGRVTNAATASGVTPQGETVTSPPSSVTIPTQPGEASITLVKSSSTKIVHRIGEQVVYQYVITNTGSVPLTGVTVTDTFVAPADPANLSPIVCGPDQTPNGQVTLAAGESVTCTATYTVTKADFHHGAITNTATATGTPPSGPAPVSPESSVTVRVKGKLPVTGGSFLVPLAGTGTAALAAGAALLLITRRRVRPELGS